MKFNDFYHQVLKEYNQVSLDIESIPPAQLIQHLEGIFEDPSNELNSITNIQRFERDIFRDPTFVQFLYKNGYDPADIRNWIRSKYEAITTPEVVMTANGTTPGAEVTTSFGG